MFVWLLLLSAVFTFDEPKEIKIDDAAKHKGEQVVVVMSVKSSSLLDGKDICFLNSHKNHRDEKNFSIVLRKEGLKAFADKEIADPSKHFRNKKIQIKGKVEEYKGKYQIIVTKFDQIKTLAVEIPEDEAPLEDENQNIRKFD